MTPPGRPGGDAPDPWADLRGAIDGIDEALLDLLNQRAALAGEVARRKQERGAELYVPARERAIIDRLQARNPGPFPTGAIRPVFQEVISACLRLEGGVRVSYLGPEATFTHQAVKRHFGTSALTLPCGSIPGVFAEVERGEAEFGVVPVENSSEGAVTHTLDSFLDSPLAIAAEIHVPIEHCLLARPGIGEAELERVYSHPQALAQCRDWLAANLPRAARVEAASTAEAARAALQDGGGAAIASELAARLYGLTVLRSKLQDTADNSTRFLVLARPEGGHGDAPPADGAGYKTTVLLAFPDRAGALFDILRPLSDARVNLTRIESRPSRRRAWDYVFFLELDGHRRDAAIAPVLDRLATDCQLFKVLGSYRKADVT
ncbi:MAG TPA: prephenate dehydratase [Kofleriaceae bacterium]|nr:prephenate dehydratase [Kofleriaceae bacterium]